MSKSHYKITKNVNYKVKCKIFTFKKYTSTKIAIKLEVLINTIKVYTQY